ncbi:MAG: radical SAM protein [Candidatus Coatesbacteria bacterium]|nr:radical SAM protein [Candidatus Coatesbacteria bacterium]
MKVFLGNSPWRKKGFYGVRAGSRWPHFERDDTDYMPFPFFLAYSAAVLEREGHEVKLVDGIAEGISNDEFLKRVKEFSPELVILEISTISIDVDLACAKSVRELCPDAKIAFCGVHTEMFDPAFLENHDCVDFAMKGEYEYTVRDLAAALKEGKSPDDVAGLLFRSNGKVVFTGDRPLIENIDELPWPARHHLPMDRYCDTPGEIPRPSVQMWASRGCPYGCVYCAWPQIMYGGSKYRVRSPIDVVDEMEHLIKEEGFKSVYFDDDTFNIGKERILKICSEIKRRRMKVPWAIMARADTMDEEMLRALEGAGLEALKYGVENATQEIVNNSGKALKLEKVQEMVKLTKSMGIWVHLTFMFGLPGETKETMDKTIDLALSLSPDSLQFSIVTPWPGSKFFKRVEKEGHLLSRNYAEYDGYNVAVIKTDTLEKEDLEAALRKANELWEKHVCERRAEFVKFGNRVKRHIAHPRLFMKKLRRRMRRAKQAKESCDCCTT